MTKPGKAGGRTDYRDDGTSVSDDRRGPAQQHGTSLESTLPYWKVDPGAKPGTANLTCPRCGGKCVVNETKWRESRQEIGRSCTYCFKVARVPKEES